LLDDYPVLAHALGERAFESLCRRYIARHPSTGPSLNYFGRHMADFCRAETGPESGFAADLAALEWAIVLAIHAPTAEVIGFDDLGRVPTERWPSARLRVNPSLAILHLGYPVNAFLQAYRRGKPTTLPAACPISVAVYRTGRSVWRLELEPALVTLVEALARGETLEVALAEVQTLLTGQSEHEVAKKISHCFQESVSSGLFSTISV
jgi:hypothetical protein